MAKNEEKAAQAAAATESDTMLKPEIGDYSTHQEVNKRAKVFWCSTIDGRRSDARTKPNMLNPLRGIPTEVRLRKPEPIDPKDPSKGTKQGKYYLITATGRFVVREEAESKDAEGKLRLCEIGEPVWVDERYAFAEFAQFLPRVIDNGRQKGTVAMEMVCIPKGVVPLTGGQTTLRYDVLGEIVDPKRCEELGIGGNIHRFLSLGGAQAPAALLTEGGTTEDNIPF